MTITQLQYILAVAEYQNFTLAAEKCFVTQPTLSMQIQKLEEQLNIKIFDRSSKPVKLTEIGEKVVLQAKKIVSESDRIQDIIDQQKGFIGGDFILGIIPTVMPTLLPLFLKNFINKFPKVNLIIEEFTTDEIIERLQKGKIDAAIAATPLEVDGIKERILYYEPFVAYIPNHNNTHQKTIEIDDLTHQNFLLLKDGHCFTHGVLNFCKNQAIDTSNKFQLRSGSFETLIKLANEGMGITILPYLHTIDLPESQEKNCIHFKDPKPAREISLLYKDSELKVQIINALRDTIISVIRAAIQFQDIQIISPKIN